MYRKEGNLGNTVQTVGLSTVIGPSRGIWYDSISNSTDELLICNGWFQSSYQKIDKGTSAVFAGVHITDTAGYDSSDTVEWMRRSGMTIGARDPGTASYLSSLGIRAELVGCASLLLPRYDGPRSGDVYVDYTNMESQATHFIPEDISWSQRWALATKALELYRTAKCVFTSRLHVALPCIAMGTPILINPNVDRRRFSILDHLGVKYGKAVEVDSGRIKLTFLNFLGSQLGRTLTQGAATMPEC